MSTTVKAKTFEDLVVWQKSHQFVLAVYGLTKTFPNSEIFGLTSQIRRAAVSVPANIAEGFKRKGKADSHSHISSLHPNRSHPFSLLRQHSPKSLSKQNYNPRSFSTHSSHCRPPKPHSTETNFHRNKLSIKRNEQLP